MRRALSVAFGVFLVAGILVTGVEEARAQLPGQPRQIVVPNERAQQPGLIDMRNFEAARQLLNLPPDDTGFGRPLTWVPPPALPRQMLVQDFTRTPAPARSLTPGPPAAAYQWIAPRRFIAPPAWPVSGMSGAWPGGACGPVPQPWWYAPSPAASVPWVPYKVADGTAPLRILYRMQNEGGRISVDEGRPAERRQVVIELNGSAAGPPRIDVEVFARDPRLPGSSFWIGAFPAVKGKGGRYVLGEEDLAHLAENFIATMNDLDNRYSVRYPVPAMTATLKITGDDSVVNAGTFDLVDALSLSPEISTRR